MMNNINEKAFKPIDQEEKDLMASIESNEWQPVKNFDRERKKAMEAARNTLCGSALSGSQSLPDR